MNWHDVLPFVIARNQIARERQLRVLRARRAGLKFKEIATRLGVSKDRARQLYLNGERASRWPSPVERYFADDRDDLRIIVWTLKNPNRLRARKARAYHGTAFGWFIEESDE